MIEPSPCLPPTPHLVNYSAISQIDALLFYQRGFLKLWELTRDFHPLNKKKTGGCKYYVYYTRCLALFLTLIVYRQK